MRANQLGALAAAIAELAPLPAPADAMLHRFFRNHHELGRADRALVSEAVFAWLRRRRSIDTLAQTSNPRLLALATLVRELGVSQRDLDAVLSERDAAWLREFTSRLSAPLDPAVAADLPDWIWERLGSAYGDDERLALARSLLAPAPLDLRTNPLKTTRDNARTALSATGVESQPTPFSPLGLRVSGRPSLAQHPLMQDGSIEVQDESSQLVGYVVAPRRSDMVVDFCAGAGGKTLLLGALMRSHGRLYAFDVVDSRLAKLKPRLARSGLSNVHAQLIASERDAPVKRLAGKIDRVLVDAPCTGLGTLRRNPDLKWRHSEQLLSDLTANQRAILASAATLVKPGGRLVYATCSLLRDENDAIVEAFLAAHPEFEQGDASAELARAGIPLATGPTMRLLPHRHGCDGFFAALLHRK